MMICDALHTLLTFDDFLCSFLRSRALNWMFEDLDTVKRDFATYTAAEAVKAARAAAASVAIPIASITTGGILPEAKIVDAVPCASSSASSSVVANTLGGACDTSPTAASRQRLIDHNTRCSSAAAGSPPRLMGGRWDTTFGVIELVDMHAFTGFEVEGECRPPAATEESARLGAAKTGDVVEGRRLSGVVYVGPLGRWCLNASLSPRQSTYRASVAANHSGDGSGSDASSGSSSGGESASGTPEINTANSVPRAEDTSTTLPALLPGALVLQFDSHCSSFSARWWYPSGTRERVAGKWTGETATAASQYRLFAGGVDNVSNTCGMLNMQDGLVNVCYQNSLWQALFHTKRLRQVVTAGGIGSKKKTKKIDGDDEVGMKPSPLHRSLTPRTLVAIQRISDEDNTGGFDSTASRGMLTGMRSLFESLERSSRAVVHTHGVQAHLPRRFRSGKQEDTSELRSFIIDSLENALALERLEGGGCRSPSSSSDSKSSSGAMMREERTPRSHQTAMASIFGGSFATHRVCATCSNSSSSTQSFKELPLAFPQRYQPITDLAVIVVPKEIGKTPIAAAPKGFERINVDLNKDRSGVLVPHVFLCVTRGGAATAESGSASGGGGGPAYISHVMVKTAKRDGSSPPFESGYTRVEPELNGGVGGERVWLFIQRRATESPVTELDVVFNSAPPPDGMKKISVSLSKGGGGAQPYLCYRQDMPLTDVALCPSGKPGWRSAETSIDIEGTSQTLVFTDGLSSRQAPVTDLRLVAELDPILHTAANGFSHVGTLPTGMLLQRRGEGCPFVELRVIRAPEKVPRGAGYEVRLHFFRLLLLLLLLLFDCSMVCCLSNAQSKLIYVSGT